MELALSLNGSSTSILYSAPGLTIPYISVVSMASVVGTLGNFLIIGTLLCSVKSRNPGTVGKIFIVNLASSDLIVTAIINPVAVAGAIIGPSLFEEGGRDGLCTFFASLCVSSCVVSLLSVGCISVNRYVYICRHTAYRRLFTRRTSYAIVAATWIIGVLLDVPSHTGWSAHTFDRKTQKCLWDRTLSHQYTVFYVTVGMLVPLAIIIVCYWRIFTHIRGAKQRILQARSGGRSAGIWTTQAAIMKTVRQIKVIFIIFIAFCICWAPYIVVLLSDALDVFPLSVHLYASMIAHLHASINFVIYGLTNKSLRAGYRDFLARRLCGCCCSAAESAEVGEDDFADPTSGTKNRSAVRRFDIVRTSKEVRKSTFTNDPSVKMNELANYEPVGGEATNSGDVLSAGDVPATEHHQLCLSSDTEDGIV